MSTPAPDVDTIRLTGLSARGRHGVMVYSNGLPRTGFTPGKVTTVGEQPAAKKYQASEITLRIPKLNVELGVTGVQKTDGNWDVSWLNGQAGYLEGSAYPTWAGNSVITAHVWDAYNNPGPFAGLKTLGYGDQVKIETFGKTYVYETYEKYSWVLIRP